MTGAEIIEAWEKWLETPTGQRLVAGPSDGANLESRLCVAFFAGIEAAEAPWRDPVVSAERLEQI